MKLKHGAAAQHFQLKHGAAAQHVQLKHGAAAQHFLKILCLFVILAIPDTAPGAPKSRFRGGAEVRGGKRHNVVREEGRTVIYKKRSVVEFDDSLIEGEVKNPNEFYFVHRPEEKFGSLVKKRRNFHKEMLRDTVMIR